MDIEKEKERINKDLSRLRETLKNPELDKIELLRNINDLTSSLGVMKVKVIAHLPENYIEI